MSTHLQIEPRGPHARHASWSAAIACVLLPLIPAEGQDREHTGKVQKEWVDTKHYAVVQRGAKNGASFCTDRGYVLRDVPESLRGSDYLKIRMDDKHTDAGKPLLRLTLSKPATVLIGYDRRCRDVPEWLQSWEATGDMVSADRCQGVLYAKEFPAGDVYLNGNRAPRANAMYMVFASPGSLASVRVPAGHPSSGRGSAGKSASYDRQADRHGFTVFMEEGGWCWYQDPRAIIHDDILFIGAVQGNGSGPALVGVYDLGRERRLGSVVMQDNFRRDDHNSPVFFPRPDGSVLAMYALHGNNRVHYYRVSKPGAPLVWHEESTYTHRYPNAGTVTYMNLYEMKNEGKLYNFFRGIAFNPCFITSTDHGDTWGEPTHFIASELPGRHRPYARYTGNGTDTVHVSFTDAHPRRYGNSIYYAAFRNGNFYNAAGDLLKRLSAGPLRPSEAERVYVGSGNPGRRADQSAIGAAWTSSIAADAQGHPHIGYTLYLSNTDHRYRIASWDGSRWVDREVAFGGTCLYDRESSYTGLISLDPVDPEVVVISTDVDPATGGHTGGNHEIYRARIALEDNVRSIRWQEVTRDSPVRNIRPLIVREGRRRVVLWNRGDFNTYTDYQLDTVGFVEEAP